MLPNTPLGEFPQYSAMWPSEFHGIVGKSLWFFLVLASFFSGSFPEVNGQVIGEKAELKRLEAKADEAIANGDPNGAMTIIGRAALMASVLAKKEPQPSTQLLFRSAEDLYRTQENVYRALALYEQAGGQSPAPSGVCQLLSLAEAHGISATKKLAKADPGSQGDSRTFYDRLFQTTQEWITLVKDLQADFSCHEPQAITP